MVNYREASNDESPENPKPKIDLTSKFVADFVRQNLKKTDWRVDFVNKIVVSWNIIDPDINEKLSKFHAENWKSYPWLDKDKITWYMLRKEVWAFYTALENKRNNFRALVINQYNISPKEFDDKIKNDISKKDENEIKWLMDSEKERNKYLSSKISGKKLEAKKTITILDWITSELWQKKFNGLSDEDKIEVWWILDNYSQWKKIWDVDLKILFESWIFTENEKKELVHTFIPIISLQRAIDIELIDESKAKNIKEKIIKEQSSNSWFSSAEVDSIIENTSYNDIDISTSDFSSKEDLSTIVKKIWFKNLSNDFNTIIDDYNAEKDAKSPQNLLDFKKELKDIKNHPNYRNHKNTDKIEEWAYIQITKSDKDWNKNIHYLKVVNTDIWWRNKIILSQIWEWENIHSILWDTWEYTYGKLLESFDSESTSVDVFTKQEIDDKIEKWSLKRVVNSYKADNAETLKLETSALNDQLVAKRKELEKTKKELKKEIDDLEDEYAKNKDSTIKARLDWLKEKYEQYKNIEDFPEYKEIYNKIVDKEDTIDNLSARNLDKLVRDIDTLDPEWKVLRLSKWIVLEDKNWFIIHIDWIDETNWKIVLKNETEFLTVDYYTFFEWFKKNGLKRHKKIEKLGEFLDEMKKWKKYDNWKKFEERDWEIFYKWNLQKPLKLEYFTNKDWKLLKILESGNWGFLIQEWDFDEKEEKDKKWNKFKKTILKIKWAKERNVTFNELQWIINQNEYKPDYEIWAKPEELREEINWNKDKNDIRWNLWSKIFNNFSINEILKWWKLVVDWFTDYLKKWNDIHAAKAALAMWKFLPSEFVAELRIKVETSEAEQMGKEIEWLSKVDSPIATKRILDWLENKDTPEYKKEAWLMFMLEKYGWLYAKSLYPKKWSFLFYRAFWWKIWDALYEEIKYKTEFEEWITFTEEYLMHMLLKRQCKADTPFYPKRRSRLHKDYENKWKSWITSEIEKWYNDASNKRKARSMLEWWMDELTWWTIANAIWWFKKSIERWWSLEDMSEWFFCMMYSWALFWLSQDVFTKIKSLWDSDGMPMIIARFSSSIEEMRIFNETVFELSKRMELEYPDKCKWMWERAEKIFKNAENPNIKEKDKITDTQKFFKDFHEPLLNALNMRNHWDTDKYSKTDKILTFADERKNTPIFQKYYDKVKWFTTESTFKKDFMDDAFKMAWIEWMNIFENVKKVLKFNSSNSFPDQNNADNLWKILSLDLKVTWKRLFHWEKEVNSITNRSKQRDYIVDRLRDFVAWCITNHWWSVNGKSYLPMYNSPTLDIWTDLNSWWLNINDSFGKFWAEQILNWIWDNELRRVADNIINWDWIWINTTNFNQQINDILDWKSITNKNVNNIINSRWSANENKYKKNSYDWGIWGWDYEEDNDFDFDFGWWDD